MIARILIVDDDENIRHVLRDFLQFKNHHILEASDGPQAFMIAEKEVPHLIITDVLMPGIYGTSLVKKLRDYWRTSKIPILVISGKRDDPLLELNGSHENMRFLKKPIDLKLLEKAIQEILPRGGYIP